MKTTFIKLQNESLPKDTGQELLIVNSSVLTCPIFFIALSVSDVIHEIEKLSPVNLRDQNSQEFKVTTLLLLMATRR